MLCRNFEKSFLEQEKMAALNQERFTLATVYRFVKCVEDVVQRNEHNFGH